jgi:hypothetical protein
MKTILVFLFFIPFLSKAQYHEPKIDSLNYYQQEINNLTRVHQQKLITDSHFIALRENVVRLSAQRDSYRGMMLYTQVADVDFSKLNADLSANGFTPLSGPLWSFGYGFTFKKNRRIFDLNATAFGMEKKTKKDGESIKVSFGTFFEFVWGYDFIKNKSINLYPYFGVGLRSTSLDYKAKAQINPSPSSIFNIVQNDRSVSDNITELSYQAGAGLEVVISKAKRSGGTLLFVKGGTNQAFKDKGFDLKGNNYNPEFNVGNFIIHAGFKFFSR